MRILQINKFFWPKGGAERYYLTLSKLLEEKGHRIIPFSMQDEKNLATSYSSYFVSPVDFSKFRISLSSVKALGRMIWFREAASKLEKLILDTKPDIAHIHNIYHHLSPSILPVLKKHKIPTVWTLHDYKIICPIYSLYTKGRICERCKKRKYWQAVINKCNKNSYLASLAIACEMSIHKLMKVYEKNVDVFIVLSQFTKRKLEEWGIQAKRFEVLPNFVEIEKSHFDFENYFVYAGRLIKNKGIWTLIKAAKKLPKNLELKIAGTGPEEEKIKDYLKKNKIRNIKLVGFLKQEALKELMKKSMFSVLPSELYEHCPLAILEAYALGKPVIGSNLGSIPELIRDGQTGLLFKPNSSLDLREKINYLASHPEKIKSFGKNAFDLVGQKYNQEDHYLRLISIYESLLKK